jgi:hypothetical protein
MAHYFIDSLLGGDLLEDTEGIEYSTYAEAEAMAFLALGDMGREMPRGREAMAATVILRNFDRSVVLQASLKLEIEKMPLS